MLGATRDRKLVTTITGSLPRPFWYTESLWGRPFSHMLNHVPFRDQYFDALTCFLNDQARAGLDVLTDGDCRFDRDVGGRAWIAYPLEHMEGLSGASGPTKFKSVAEAAPGTLMREIQGAPLWPYATGKLGRGHMDYARIWKAAQGLTRKPVKFGTISAQILSYYVTNRFYEDDDELLTALCDVMNEELREVADAGCPIIQIEDPLVHFAALDPHVKTSEMERWIGAFNREVAGVRAEIWYHSCWGNPSQQRVYDEVQSYERCLEWMVQCDADVITLETAATGGADLKHLERVQTDKKFAIGVIDHRNCQVETPQQVASLIRKALEYVPPERLVVSTDCGFGREGLPRRVAFYKIVSLVQGTNLVRRELGLPEADVLVADPKLQLF
ncbi:MAG TPA: cobalamin-independent methionine synthase II family protein [Candidatus Binatia bacterium]|nr:cobalamin-independent methionine synthase II family protein [Candidatus Binatia bacterium]